MKYVKGIKWRERTKKEGMLHVEINYNLSFYKYICSSKILARNTSSDGTAQSVDKIGLYKLLHDLPWRKPKCVFNIHS